MRARLASLLAALAVVVLTAAAFAHAPAAGTHAMGSGQAGAVMPLSGGDPHDCGGQLSCTSTESAACEMLCAGISALLPQLADATVRSFAPVTHDRLGAMFVAGPVLDPRKRPPIL